MMPPSLTICEPGICEGGPERRRGVGAHTRGRGGSAREGDEGAREEGAR